MTVIAAGFRDADRCCVAFPSRQRRDERCSGSFSCLRKCIPGKEGSGRSVRGLEGREGGSDGPLPPKGRRTRGEARAGRPDGSPLRPHFPFQLEGQCTALHIDKHETKAENAQLKQSNQELARELARTSQELQEAQQQLQSLQQEVHRLHQDKEL